MCIRDLKKQTNSNVLIGPIILYLLNERCLLPNIKIKKKLLRLTSTNFSMFVSSFAFPWTQRF